jgi:hypothetical protein
MGDQHANGIVVVEDNLKFNLIRGEADVLELHCPKGNVEDEQGQRSISMQATVVDGSNLALKHHDDDGWHRTEANHYHFSFSSTGHDLD